MYVFTSEPCHLQYFCFYILNLKNNFIFHLFRAEPVAYGGPQARDQIGAVAASLCQSHSNTGSELSLQSIPQRMVTPDP